MFQPGPVWQWRAMVAHSAEPLTPRLIDSLYTEAMLLADEARSYFEGGDRNERHALDPLTRVGFSCESLKVTTRLMHVIAWLLGQRAHAKLGADVAPPVRKLGNASDSDAALVARLPGDAQSLIASSCDLYARVRRLADSAGGDVGAGPARALMNRLERSM